MAKKKQPAGQVVSSLVPGAMDEPPPLPAAQAEELEKQIKRHAKVSNARIQGALSFAKFTGKLELPPGLSCHELDLEKTKIVSLPADLKVRFRLDCTDCTELTELPTGLKVGSLVLAGCRSLKALPEGLDVSFLDISDCPQLTAWPKQAKLSCGRLRARNCVGLTALPGWLKHVSQLDLRGCRNISALPRGIRIDSWIDVAGTGLTALPRALRGVGIRWRGVPVDERIAFHPEKIGGAEVLAETNAERRRVMLERVGYQRFLQEVNAELLDEDRDTGGPRQLFRVKLEGDEDLVCVSVLCPSTERQYLIRVPPKMKSCHQAIAWTAGFDDPKLYQPLVET